MSPNITLFRGLGSDMIIDGNKTAVAVHHLDQGKKEISVQVFVIAPK